MASQTPRLGLDTYSAGESDWSHTDTVNQVDESAIVRDTIANRPTSGEYDDELFYATDQRLLWRWDASTDDWVIAGGLGTNTVPVPGTAHYTALAASDIDGVSTTTKYHIESGESGTIPNKHSSVVKGPMDVDGSLEVLGRLEIL